MAARSILHVIPSVAPRYGGPSAAVVGMCRAVREAGCETLIATTDADGMDRLDVPLGEVTSFEGVPTIFFRRQATEAFKWSAPLAAWLRRQAGTFDVVHAHAVFSHAPLAAARACTAAGVPYILRPLGTLDPWSVGRKSWRKGAVLRLGAREALHGAAAIHYTTVEEQRLVEQGFPGLPEGVVIPVGVDDWEGSARVAGADRPFALVLSRLDGKKRIEWVIDAWHRLTAGGDSAWTLVIAGDGQPAYVDRLRALAASGPGAARIIFRGWVQGDEKRMLLSGASLFLLPSQQENLGIALIEAMASGVPPIVTPGVNLAAEIEAAGAGWSVANDFASVFDGLTRAIRDDTERRARGARARAFAERFRWPVIGRQLADLYERLAQRSVRQATSRMASAAPTVA